jgi:hypothetical protein
MPGDTLKMIMEKDTDGDGHLWACRGAGKGCKRNLTRAKTKHCEDCVAASDPNETLEHLIARLKRGDS